MEYKASHRFADMSARKVRPFADLIRGKSVDEALQLLRFEPNRGARLVEQVLKSAMGNAEDRGARDPEDLIVTEARIDDGPMFKRIMPRARGTAYMILRRLCHVRVTIGDEPIEETESPETAPAVSVTTPAAPAPNVAPAPAPAQ
ncbi:MAG TPA: 50S ribosomal protein L22 [Gemmataceae bacterium]|nr:50S ribosomal protein L22 [Gemmataceae bacterium]